MARIKLEGYDRFEEEFARISGPQVDEIVRRALYEGAAMVHDAISVSLQSSLSGKGTGDLKRSLGISRMQLDEDGTWHTKVGFSGYDRKGVPNILKARALNSGTSKQPKTQFMDKAIRGVRKKAESRMATVIGVELLKLFNNL